MSEGLSRLPADQGWPRPLRWHPPWQVALGCTRNKLRKRCSVAERACAGERLSLQPSWCSPFSHLRPGEAGWESKEEASAGKGEGLLIPQLCSEELLLLLESVAPTGSELSPDSGQVTPSMTPISQVSLMLSRPLGCSLQKRKS